MEKTTLQFEAVSLFQSLIVAKAGAATQEERQLLTRQNFARVTTFYSRQETVPFLQPELLF